MCEESKEAFAVSLIVFPDEQKFTNLSQTSSTFTKIYTYLQGSVTITFNDIVAITINMTNSIFTIAFSSLSIVEGELQKARGETSMVCLDASRS